MNAFDVYGAFLNPNIKSPTYISIKSMKYGEEDEIWKLMKTMYGLKESPRQWYDHLSSNLLKGNYICSFNDSCLWYKKDKDDIIIIIIHVDDMPVFTSNVKLMDEFRNYLTSIYKITEKGTPLTDVIGIQFTYNNDKSVSLSTPGHIQKIVKNYNILNIKNNMVPMSPSRIIKNSLVEYKKCDITKYQQLLGDLSYAVKTRLDISTAVNILATKTHMCTTNDYEDAITVATYLKSTPNKSLNFFPQESIIEPDRFYGYGDATLDTEIESKSRGGLSISEGLDNGHYNTRSFVIKELSMSSFQSENHVSVELVKEIIVGHSIKEELGIKVIKPAYVHTDNEPNFILTTNLGAPGARKRVKHFLRRIQFMKEHQQSGEIMMVLVPGKDLCADVLTKPLAANEFFPKTEFMMGNRRYKESKGLDSERHKVNKTVRFSI